MRARPRAPRGHLSVSTSDNPPSGRAAPLGCPRIAAGGPGRLRKSGLAPAAGSIRLYFRARGAGRSAPLIGGRLAPMPLCSGKKTGAVQRRHRAGSADPRARVSFQKFGRRGGHQSPAAPPFFGCLETPGRWAETHTASAGAYVIWRTAPPRPGHGVPPSPGGVRHLGQHVAMTGGRRTPAYQVAPPLEVGVAKGVQGNRIWP